MNEFELLSIDELNYIEAGCRLCKIGATIAGASTGAGIVFSLSSNPVGWVVAAGAVVGGGLGYLSAS